MPGLQYIPTENSGAGLGYLMEMRRQALQEMLAAQEMQTLPLKLDLMRTEQALRQSELQMQQEMVEPQKELMRGRAKQATVAAGLEEQFGAERERAGIAHAKAQTGAAETEQGLSALKGEVLKRSPEFITGKVMEEASKNPEFQRAAGLVGMLAGWGFRPEEMPPQIPGMPAITPGPMRRAMTELVSAYGKAMKPKEEMGGAAGKSAVGAEKVFSQLDKYIEGKEMISSQKVGALKEENPDRDTFFKNYPREAGKEWPKYGEPEDVFGLSGLLLRTGERPILPSKGYDAKTWKFFRDNQVADETATNAQQLRYNTLYTELIHNPNHQAILQSFGDRYGDEALTASQWDSLKKLFVQMGW